MLSLARVNYIHLVTSEAAVSASRITMSVIRTLTIIVDRIHTGKDSVACEESQLKAVGEVCVSHKVKTTLDSLIDLSITNELPALQTTTLAITIYLKRCIIKIMKSPKLRELKAKINLRI